MVSSVFVKQFWVTKVKLNSDSMNISSYLNELKINGNTFIVDSHPVSLSFFLNPAVLHLIVSPRYLIAFIPGNVLPMN